VQKASHKILKSVVQVARGQALDEGQILQLLKTHQGALGVIRLRLHAKLSIRLRERANPATNLELYTEIDPNPEEESNMKMAESSNKVTTVVDVDVVRFGEKIVVPEGLDLKSAIGALTRKAAEEDQDLAISHDFNLTPPEGAIAFLRTLTEMFGFVSPKETPSFFGPQPPTFVTIETGPDKTESVPWGRMQIPGISGYLQPSINWVDGAPRFRLTGTVKGKNKAMVQKIADNIRKRTDSLYRGKAIYATFPEPGTTDSIDDYFPKFMRLPNIDESDLIFSTEIQDLIATALFTPIEHSQVCRDNNISLKRGVLLEGPYGTGKTLTATVTARKCVANGWTFIYLRDVKQLPQAINFSKAYTPAVIFAEDIDQVLANPDHRDEEVNGILNSIDGIDSKGVEIITVLTTNNVDKITTAMLRPGRLDTVVPVRPPDAEAAIRLVKLFAGDQIAADQDFTEVGASLKGCIPAMIQEVVERSKLGAVRRAARGGILEITAHDVEVAALSMIAHMRLLEPKVPDTRSDRERAAEILGERLGKSLGEVLTSASQKSNGKSTVASDVKPQLPVTTS
jgi:transitional endoplasmic reticulum ATPase